MAKKIPPLYHFDGSNCWTENCSRGNTLNKQEKADRGNFGGKIEDMLDGSGIVKYTVVFSEDELSKHIKEQLVTVGRNTEYPQLSIYKYSRTAQFRKVWTDVTYASRGLVINHETGELVARPFPKFFNYQELSEDEIREKAVGPMRVMEKLDGSLIIGYVDPDGKYRLTTGGGFGSSQRELAETIYEERYAGEWTPRPNTTYMWELIHPENRIVVDYGDEEDIHLLGAVNIRTGRSIPLEELTEWRWKKAAQYHFDTLDDVVSSPNRPNAEGYIVHFPETDFRMKLKHEDYVALHRDATGLSERRVWNYLKDGTYEENKANLLEEFMEFYEKTGAEILSKVEAEKSKYYDEFAKLEESFEGSTKLEWVKHVRKHGTPDRISVMLSWFGREDKTFTILTENKLWDMVKPAETRSMWQLKGLKQSE